MRRKRKEPEPRCGCGHHLAMHDPDSKHCHAQWQFRPQPGAPLKLRDCTCRQYVGPMPVDTFFVNPTIFSQSIIRAEHRE